MEEGRDHFESDDSQNDENMSIENENPLEENNQESNSSEEEIEEEGIFLNNIHFKYNEEEFKKENILKFLFDNNILKNNLICEVYEHPMNLVNLKKRIDGKIWRCKKKGLEPHDIKVNIRNNSIFSNFKTDIRILYFLLFYNFVENKSVKDSYLNCKELSKQLKIGKVKKRIVSKFFNTIRIKIKNKMHKTWAENKLGIEPGPNGKSYCEIDESKIINYNNETRWMFGIYDRGTSEVRIFFVDNNRTKETLLPIIQKNVYTYYNSIENNADPNDEIYPTRIFSDYFQTYQINDFNNLGYKLYKVNHSVWFGQGHFHTNSIESTWSRLKRLTKSFNGLNGNIFNTRKDFNNTEYFDGWICTGIFFMQCESRKLALNGKKSYLIDFIKVDA